MKKLLRIVGFCLGFLIISSTAPGDVELRQIGWGFNNPLLVTHAGDGSGRLFVVEKAGVVKIIDEATILSTPFLDISTQLVANSERGLLGFAFHPDYPTDNRFFVYYTRSPDGASVISEFQVSADPNVAEATSENIILTFSQPESNHNGGHIAFSPIDGYLYIGTGDGGGSNDQHGAIGNGQDLTTLLGKILRIDIDSASPYSIPPTNPYALSATAEKEIYAYGLRNPWRFSFDSLDGRLFCGDVGQNEIEEIDLIENGDNLGWRRMEGSDCFNPSSGCQTGNLVLPIHEYPQAAGRCSITGGYVYRGSLFTSYVGKYFYGDYCTGEIWTLEEISPGVFTEELVYDATFSISSFGEGEDGELYVCNFFNGRIFQIYDPELINAWVTY